ncbi:hypothetical protein FD755_020644, partial [Muntiacus reevesi]
PGRACPSWVRPYCQSAPIWLKLTADDVKEEIYKLANLKSLTSSQICNKILRILKSKGLAPDLPEDLYHLIKKAAAVRKHLERNRKDKDAKFHLTLIEILPTNWKYESCTASALVA